MITCLLVGLAVAHAERDGGRAGPYAGPEQTKPFKSFVMVPES
jgi:hypothetical protein